MSRSPLAPILAAGLLVCALCPSRARAATLDEALDAAERNSAMLKVAREQVVQAEAWRGQAFALVSPKLVSEATYTINDKEIVLDFAQLIPEELSSFIDTSSFEAYVLQQKRALAVSGSVIQPIFDAQSMPLLRAAYANVDSAEQKVRRATQQVRGGAAQAYYGAAVARGMERLAARAVEQAKAHKALADKQVELGLAPGRASIQAELGVARAERDLAQAREGVSAAEQAFTSLTGLPREEATELPSGAMAVPDSLDEALARANASRPDILAAGLDTRAAQLQATGYRLDWLPTLDARFTYAYSDNTGFTDDKTIWMLVFKANWLLWDGGARIGQTRVAASQARQARALAEQTALDVASEVRAAWERMERASASLAAANHENELAVENLRLAEIAYQSGGLTLLEVEDARLGTLASEMTQLQERANRDLAAIALRVAMGDF